MNLKISPCLWFDNQAEEAANFYVSIFPDSEVTAITRYSDAGNEIHGRPTGSVMTAEFTLAGQTFTALNGGPIFKLSEASSCQLECEDQREIDYYWEKLGADGDPGCQQCGWLKDKFGLSWQVVPKIMPLFFADHTSEKTRRAMNAMLGMKKLDIASLQDAYDGK